MKITLKKVVVHNLSSKAISLIHSKTHCMHPIMIFNNSRYMYTLQYNKL